MINQSEELAKVVTYYGIGDAYELKYKIVCPLHGDINPSMVIDLEKGEWFCFGCQTGGTAFDLVLAIEKKYHALDEMSAGLKYARILQSKKVQKIKVNCNVKKDESIDLERLDIAKDYYYGLSKIDWRRETDKKKISLCNT